MEVHIRCELPHPEGSGFSTEGINILKTFGEYRII